MFCRHISYGRSVFSCGVSYALCYFWIKAFAWKKRFSRIPVVSGWFSGRIGWGVLKRLFAEREKKRNFDSYWRIRSNHFSEFYWRATKRLGLSDIFLTNLLGLTSMGLERNFINQGR
jgi:hypothetical protein